MGVTDGHPHKHNAVFTIRENPNSEGLSYATWLHSYPYCLPF
ncbi:hypothetical protein QUW46_08445 [Limosilactobacillus panis]|uniref:Uncharacterized protein n=1 Tax=Limosilactobacillus panis TaxID=47493 RepID=A0ABT7VPC3_9LACO|nr:hypothetical protein [Limosilactobacillus panis]